MTAKTLLLALPLALAPCGAARAAAADLAEAGVAAEKITPPPGTLMAGYYFDRVASGVHDDLFAKAIVIQSGGVRAALVACDLIGVPRECVEAARRAIEAATGIPGAHVMISATHAHTGPVVRSPAGARRASGGGKESATAFAEALPGLIAAGAAAACANLAPARISAARGFEDSLSFNRRFHMKDGTVGWNPGRLNPNILRPAGPIDPDVPVVHFASAQGAPLAMYVNFAMHLDTVGGLEISADYPYTLGKLLGGLKPGMLTVFTQGAAGDINHIDVAWGTQTHGHVEAARIGTVLAGAVTRTFPHLAAVSAGPLQCRSRLVALPLPEIAAEAPERARAIIARRGLAENPPAFLELVEAYKVIDVAERGGKPLEAEVQVITLGDTLAWVGLPGEIFVELGLAIKRSSPFAQTMVVELANGSIGYVPTRHAWPQGNYEVASARCGPGSGEMLCEAASCLLREAHAAAVRAAPR